MLVVWQEVLGQNCHPVCYSAHHKTQTGRSVCRDTHYPAEFPLNCRELTWSKYSFIWPMSDILVLEKHLSFPQQVSYLWQNPVLTIVQLNWQAIIWTDQEMYQELNNNNVIGCDWWYQHWCLLLYRKGYRMSMCHEVITESSLPRGTQPSRNSHV